MARREGRSTDWSMLRQMLPARETHYPRLRSGPRSMFTELQTLNPQLQTPEPSTLNPQYLTLKPSTLNPQPSILNSKLQSPQPSTLNPQPSILNSKPQSPQPSTLNPQPSTLRLFLGIDPTLRPGPDPPSLLVYDPELIDGCFLGRVGRQLRGS